MRMTYAHNHKQRNAVGMAIERGGSLDYAGEGQAGGVRPACYLLLAKLARC
jgi:hypothetical protein